MGHSLRLLDKKKRQSTLKMTAKAVETTPNVDINILRRNGMLLGEGGWNGDPDLAPPPTVTNDEQYQNYVSTVLESNSTENDWWTQYIGS